MNTTNRPEAWLVVLPWNMEVWESLSTITQLVMVLR